MATDQKVGGSNPLAHVVKMQEAWKQAFLRFLFSAGSWLTEEWKDRTINTIYRECEKNRGDSMDRNEFISTLRAVLTGEVSAAVVEDNVRYYDSYISQEIAGGKSEKEVLDSLGDPRLIAKTIADTQGGQGAYYGGGSSYNQEPPVRERGGRSEERENGGGEWKYHRINLNTWYGRLLILVITILVLALVFTIVGGILSWVLPVLVPVLLIVWVIRMFFGGGRRGW